MLWDLHSQSITDVEAVRSSLSIEIARCFLMFFRVCIQNRYLTKQSLIFQQNTVHGKFLASNMNNEKSSMYFCSLLDVCA